MSTFNISDIHFAGAYANAVTAAKDSDHRNAERHLEPGEGSNVTKAFKAQVRRIATAIVEMRPTADRLRARPV
jgi:hypothetical protein